MAPLDVEEMEKQVEELEKEVERRKNKVIELELEAEEQVVAKGFSRVYTPSREDYDRHCLTHIPYRSWCPICVQAKKRNPPHRRVQGESGIPVFSMDYMFLNGKESLSNPILVVTESESGGVWTIPVIRKGISRIMRVNGSRRFLRKLATRDASSSQIKSQR